MSPRYSLITLSVLMATFVVLSGCEVGDAQDAAAPPPPEVTVAKASIQRLRDWADFTGRIEPVESVEIRPRVAGFVESVHFVEGGHVQTGDLLFQIDARPFRVEVLRLRAERQRARAELDIARRYEGRSERLLAQNATSEEEFERFSADAAVAAARLEAVEAALDSAELQLSFTRVTAPISGRVSRAVVTEGNLVDDSSVLTSVVSQNPVYVYFDVDEQVYLEHLGRGRDAGGAEVLVGLIDEEAYPHSATLDFVDNRVDPNHGTIRARAVLDNTAGQFTPGLFARLKLVSTQSYRAALVDDRAIGTDLDRKFVLVVDEDAVVQYRPVEAGRLVAGMRVVKSGLEAGDRVVVNGLQRVRPGVTVSTTETVMHGRAPELDRFLVVEDADTRLASNAR